MFFYKKLGLQPYAKKDEIKNAYRNLAKIYHPDLNDTEGTDLIFKTLKIAYEILTNDYTRQKYDNSFNPVNEIYAHDFLSDLEKEVKKAYLADLSISIDLKTKVSSNVDYYIAVSINNLTVNREISPVKIEEAIMQYRIKIEASLLVDIKSGHSIAEISKESKIMQPKIEPVEAEVNELSPISIFFMLVITLIFLVFFFNFLI
jgi:curved DNA-binding protein CbpA